MLDFTNKDGPVIQSRPSSIYEKRNIRSPTRNDSSRIEPIYEPILPPALPIKTWENEANLIFMEKDSEVDASIVRQNIHYAQRGPTPLQRSPVMDNVALKALSEEQNLKAREASLAEDIAEQLTQISKLTQQHMSKQGLVQTSASVKEENLNNMYKPSTEEKLHTLNYKASILKSRSKDDNDTSSAITLDLKPNENSVSEHVIQDESKGNYKIKISYLEHAQAQESLKLCHDYDKVSNKIDQKKHLEPEESYTQVSKARFNDEPAKMIDFELASITQVPGKDIKLQEKYDGFVDALEVMSSKGQGLPYIDESRENNTIDNEDYFARHSYTRDMIQTNMLPCVEEDLGKF